jgi:hypothetical protein
MRILEASNLHLDLEATVQSILVKQIMAHVAMAAWHACLLSF